jgi:photosystem P840 reaction center protein PscD
MTKYKSGNPVHKVEKYFIHSTERNEYGALKLNISSASGHSRVNGTEELKSRISDGSINLFVLSNNEQIRVNLQVKLNEDRYVTDFDGRGVKWTVREIEVFVNLNNNELSVEVNGRVYTLDEFFE